MSDSGAEKHLSGIDAALGVWRRLRSVLGVSSGLMVCAMMFLTFADVLGRYVFTRPILGAYEITEVLMGLMIFCGLPLVSASKGHIRVDLLCRALPGPFRAINVFLVDLACGLLSGVLAWRAWLYGNRLREVGETTLELKISWGLVTQIISVLLLITAAVFVINACRAISDSRRPGRKE